MGEIRSTDDAATRPSTCRGLPASVKGPHEVGPLVPLLVGIVGAVATLIAAKGRFPGLGNDATSYVAIADHIAAGKGLGYFLEPKLALWPPGWPMLLAFPKWAFGVNPQYTGLAVNALMPLAIAYLSWAILRRTVSDTRLVLAGVLIAALGPATLAQTYFVQTEPTFVALSLLVVWAAIRFSDTGRPIWLAVGVVGQWLAFMDRYVGIVLIGSVALWMLLDRAGPPIRRRVGQAVGYGIAASIVPGLWILRNEHVVGNAFGPRNTPVATFKRNVVDAITSVGQFVHGYAEYQPFEGLARLATLALLACIGLGAVLLLRRIYAARRSTGDDGVGTTVLSMIGSPVGLLAIYALAHFVYMIFSASTIAFDSLNTRDLIPLFVPTLIVCLAIVDRGTRSTVNAADRPDWLRLVAFGAVGMLVIVQLGVSAARVSASYWTDKAQTYNSQRALDIRSSAVFDRVPSDCRLMSDFPEFSYLSGHVAARSPRSRAYASTDRVDDLQRLERSVANGEKWCLVWVDQKASNIFALPSYQYPLSTLQQHFDLSAVASSDGVTVYRVGPKG